MSNQLIIETKDLSYGYNSKEPILKNINLMVPQGSIYGFLGPNGSGKTTTLSLLLGLLRNKPSNIKILGMDLKKNRLEILKKTGSIIENPSLYGHLSAQDNLKIHQVIHKMPKSRVTELLQQVGLADTGAKTVKKFSLGMKQRLSIALSLLHDPKLLILDEPSNGLDPAGIVELRELLKKLNKEKGITIVVSSHILSEVEKMASHIGIIYKGQLLFQGALEELYEFQQSQINELVIKTSDDNEAAVLLQRLLPKKDLRGLTIPITSIEMIADVTAMLVANNLKVYQIQPKEHNLEQLFMNLTSH